MEIDERKKAPWFFEYANSNDLVITVRLNKTAFNLGLLWGSNDEMTRESVKFPLLKAKEQKDPGAHLLDFDIENYQWLVGYGVHARKKTWVSSRMFTKQMDLIDLLTVQDAFLVGFVRGTECQYPPFLT